MGTKTHAVLAPSSKEWIYCSLSAMFLATKKDEPSEASEFGSECHDLGEYLVRESLNLTDFDPDAPKSKEALISGFSHYSEEMEELAQAYASFVVSTFEYEKNKTGETPVIMLEQELPMDYSPDAKGTLDCGIISGDTLTIIDNKTGRKKVMAYLEDKESINSQLGIYAYFAYKLYGDIYDIKNIRLVVFQERIHNTNEYTLSAESLCAWADAVLYPAAKKALGDERIGTPGDHCEYCPGRAICRARNEELMKSFENLKAAPLMKDDEIEALLPRFDELSGFISDVKEYCLKKALEGKRTWNGYRLVETETKRKISDPDAVATLITKEGYDPYGPLKLLGITDLQKKLGKPLFEKLVGPYIIKPKGQPELAPMNDKRCDYQINTEESETC